MDKFSIENIADFHLDHIFDCGQCFRWQKQKDGSYTGLAQGMDKPVNMVFDQQAKKLTITNCTEAEFQNFWKYYLDLDRDYGQIKRKLSANDPTMEEAIAAGEGIRILNQDLWETIVSFIISQNNNIPRIKGCIEKLAELFGQPAGEYEGRAWFHVPAPEVLASLTAEELEPVRLGYRAKYLIGSAKAVTASGLPENDEQLLALPGVGTKVANCIRLFGMRQHQAFPVDVWMARVMHQLYGIDEKNHKDMIAYAAEHFGELGGFAQQYLFYYIRQIS